MQEDHSAAEVERKAKSEMPPFCVKLGAPQPRTTVKQVESRGGHFQGFGLRLWQYLMDDREISNGSHDDLGANPDDDTTMACMTVRTKQSQSLYLTQPCRSMNTE